jgi:hypothetical protein
MKSMPEFPDASLQSQTLRDAIETNVAETTRRITGIGYRRVEPLSAEDSSVFVTTGKAAA